MFAIDIEMSFGAILWLADSVKPLNLESLPEFNILGPCIQVYTLLYMIVHEESHLKTLK